MLPEIMGYRRPDGRFRHPQPYRRHRYDGQRRSYGAAHMLSGEGLRAFLPRVRPRRNERRPCPAQPPLHQYRSASQRVRRHRRGFGRSDRRIYFRRDREGRQARGGLLHRRSGRHRRSGVSRRSGRHPDASRCGPPAPNPCLGANSSSAWNAAAPTVLPASSPIR